MRLTKLSLRETFDSFDDHWHPRVVANVNDFALKAVKVEDEFLWHHHAEDDEIFLVIRGRIEHKPVAAPGTELMLIERLETANAGNVVDSERRREPLPLC